MKALVTGSCGFIGSHLVEACAEADSGLKRFVYVPSFAELSVSLRSRAFLD